MDRNLIGLIIPKLEFTDFYILEPLRSLPQWQVLIVIQLVN